MLAGFPPWFQRHHPRPGGGVPLRPDLCRGFPDMPHRRSPVPAGHRGGRFVQEILRQPGPGLSPADRPPPDHLFGPAGTGPGSGIAGLLYSDPFWGPISVDLLARGNGLPSGHVITLTATAVAVWPLKRVRPAVLVLLALTVVAVLYLGIHWPLDVLAGLILGAACGLGPKNSKRWERKEFTRGRPGSP